MAKVRKKYNPQKTIMYNLQKSIKINNVLMPNEINHINEIVKIHLDTVAYLHKTNIVNNELLSRLVDLAHFFEISIVYKEEASHYINYVKPQFKKDGLINLDFMVEEANQLKEIIKLVLQDEIKKLNKNNIELIENITNYVIDCLRGIKCKVTICELNFYSKQQNKLFLFNYPELYDYYKKSCEAYMPRLSKYILNKEKILTKYVLQNKYAIFNENTYSFDFIDKKELNSNYKLTNLEGVIECVN